MKKDVKGRFSPNRYLGSKSGLRLVFEGQGHGIPDMELALKAGVTIVAENGVKTGGSKRLVNRIWHRNKLGKDRTKVISMEIAFSECMSVS